MPNFANYNNTEAKMSDGFEPTLPGAYVLRVVAVRTQWTERDFQTGLNIDCATVRYNEAGQVVYGNEPAVMLVYDIADGTHAGEYSKDYFMKDGAYDQEKDYAHQYKFIWGDLNNPTDAASTKWVLESFTGSNPGFDALAAFNADRFDLFTGKLFGAVLNGTVKTNDKGYDSWTLRPRKKIYSTQELANGVDREGKPIAEPRITDKRKNVDGGAAAGASTTADAVPVDAYDDLPFA